MNLGHIALFGALKQRLNWLTQRQEVLARNIANADTPNYRPRDLQAFRFRDMVGQGAAGGGAATGGALSLAATDRSHLTDRSQGSKEFREQTMRDPYETAPAGNAVVLEEQLAKANETAVAHKLTTQLYRKQLGMIRMVLASKG
jgi:flagellar basal-body rod protein FlgB